MATKKKMLQAAAGQAGGAGLDITEVFSTYLYEGTNQADTIVNNIDLSGEGGMTWIKERTGTSGNVIFDTERGATKRLISYATNAESTAAFDVTAFNSDGFSVGDSIQVNGPSRDYASWTFRKAPKFFTCLTYTGNGVAGRTISHDLGTTVGMLVIKRTDTSGADWIVYHRSEAGKWGKLNETGAFGTSYAPYYFGNNSIVIPPTSTEFTVGNAGGPINASGGTYVAYLFAHNDGDGEFGPDGDQDIIKCGSYTGNGSTDGPEIDLGFEPQWLLWKNADGTDNWEVADVMRGMPADGTTGSMRILRPNTSGSEFSDNETEPKPTGFKITNAGGNNNDNGSTYIYMAIRRGPLAQPESATDVFAMDGFTARTSGSWFRSGFPVDFALRARPNNEDEKNALSRLTGDKMLRTDSTGAEVTSGNAQWDWMDGYADAVANSSFFSWLWKRAPGFCDVVAFSGDGVAGRTVSHNLGVAPEMMWVKKRSGAESWAVYHKLYGGTHFARLNQTGAFESNSNVWDNTNPTASVFTVDQDTEVNQSGQTYIAYLFATVAGVSKVGSVSHTSGSATNVDCGFTSGARFILLKVADSSGSWFVYDTARGIVAGNDARLKLDSSAAENTGNDDIDPLSSGFTITSTVSTGSYIFYAIA